MDKIGQLKLQGCIGTSKEEKDLEKRKKDKKKQENAIRNENHKKELIDIHWPEMVKKEVDQSMEVLSLPNNNLDKWSKIKQCKEKLDLLLLIRETVFNWAYVVVTEDVKNVNDLKKVSSLI